MKSKPIGIRYDIDKMATLMAREQLPTVQAAITFLLDRYEPTQSQDGTAHTPTKKKAPHPFAEKVLAQKFAGTSGVKYVPNNEDGILSILPPAKPPRLPGEGRVAYGIRTEK